MQPQTSWTMTTHLSAHPGGHVSPAGVRVAIDECYEVTDSGLISIPWDFSTQDLQAQLLKLLGPKSARLRAPPASHGAEASMTSCLTAQQRCSRTSGMFTSQNVFTHFIGARLFSTGTAQCHMQYRQCTAFQSHTTKCRQIVQHRGNQPRRPIVKQLACKSAATCVH